MKVKSLTYIGSRPLVRNTFEIYQFQVGIVNKASALYDVVGLESGKSNYEFFFFYDSTNQTNGSVYSNMTHLALWDTADTGAWLMSGMSVLLNVNISRGMEFDSCANTSYLCMLIRDAAEASFTEPDLQDNLFCADISMVKQCQPGNYPKHYFLWHLINHGQHPQSSQLLVYQPCHFLNQYHYDSDNNHFSDINIILEITTNIAIFFII